MDQAAPDRATRVAHALRRSHRLTLTAFGGFALVSGLSLLAVGLTAGRPLATVLGAGVLVLAGIAALAGINRAEELRVVAVEADRAHLMESVSTQVDEVRELAETGSERADALRQAIAAARGFNAAVEPQHLQASLGDAVAELTRVPAVAVWTVGGEREILVLEYRTPAHRELDVPTSLSFTDDVPVARAARFGRPSRDLAFSPAGELAAVAAVPMVASGRVIGVVEVTGSDGEALSDDVVGLLEVLAGYAATAYDAAMLQARAIDLARRDALTGLFTAGQLDEDLAQEVGRAERYGRPLSLILLDVDRFRSFNDEHGRQAGDRLLQGLGNLLIDQLRETDTAYRYGGEEFVLLLRETTGEDALGVAERIREQITTALEPLAMGSRVTASLGVAGLLETGGSAMAVLDGADTALNEAKGKGGDRAELAPDRDRLRPL